jgi:hypothetical protein
MLGLKFEPCPRLPWNKNESFVKLIRTVHRTVGKGTSFARLEDALADESKGEAGEGSIDNTYKLRKYLKTHGGYAQELSCCRYDVCPNDCILFMGNFENATECPNCGFPRVAADGTTRPYFYLTPIDMARRALASRTYSKLLEYPMERPQAPKGTYTDVHDGARMRAIRAHPDLVKYGKYLLVLSVGIDGICKNGNDTSYSVQPVIGTWLNVSPALRTTSKFKILLGLVPGPGANNLEVFMWPLLADMQGEFMAYDVLDGEWHKCKFVLAWTVSDLRGIGKVTDHIQFGGISGCHHCYINGVHVKECGTVIYDDYWTRLPQEHPLRKGGHKHRLPDQKTLKRSQTAPGVKTHESALTDGQAAEACSLATSNKQHPRRTKGQMKEPFLNTCPYMRCGESNLTDLMHQNANCAKLMANCMSGRCEGDLFKGKKADAKVKGKPNLNGRSAVKKPTRKRKVPDEETRASKGRARLLMEHKRKKFKEVDMRSRIIPWPLVDAEVDIVQKRTSYFRSPRHVSGNLRQWLRSTHAGRLKSHDWMMLTTGTRPARVHEHPHPHPPHPHTHGISNHCRPRALVIAGCICR